MKKLLLIAVLCISPFPVRTAQAEDGIYERSQDTSAALVKTQDGQQVLLGERQTLQILKTEMFSQNNENTKFYLSVTKNNLGGASRALMPRQAALPCTRI